MGLVYFRRNKQSIAFLMDLDPGLDPLKMKNQMNVAVHHRLSSGATHVVVVRLEAAVL